MLAHRIIVCWLCLFAPTIAWAQKEIDLVRVLKAQHKLQLISQGKVQREFSIALGANPKGLKQKEGDKKTPEGLYRLDYKKSDSAFYKAIHISYPNAKDASTARELGILPGGQIMIHGQKNGLGWLAPISQRFDWTNGCVALSNADMDVVWTLVKTGTPIELLP